LAKAIPFSVVVKAAAKAEFDALEAFERRAVSEAINANLVYQPLVEARKRKLLGELKTGFAYVPPLWELKVGGIRVFYSVDSVQRFVTIRAIRRKPPHMTTEEVVR